MIPQWSSGSPVRSGRWKSSISLSWNALRLRRRPPDKELSRLSLRLYLREQFLLGFDVLVVERQEGFERRDVTRETFPQLFRGGVVKVGDVLVQVRDDQLVAQFLGILHRVDSAAQDRLVMANRDQCLDVEELVAAGLQE